MATENTIGDGGLTVNFDINYAELPFIFGDDTEDIIKRTLISQSDLFLEQGLSSVLDLGAADGRNALPLAQAGYSVNLVERNPSQLESFRKRYAALSSIMGRAVIAGGSIEDFDFGVTSLDHILSIRSFQFLAPEDLERVLIDCIGSTRESGLNIFTIPLDMGGQIEHTHDVDKDLVPDLYRDNGWRIIDNYTDTIPAGQLGGKVFREYVLENYVDENPEHDVLTFVAQNSR